LILLAAEHLLELEFLHSLGRLLVFGIQLFVGGIACFVKFIENLEVLNKLVHTLVGVGPDLLGPDVFENGFGLSRIVPEVVLVRDPLLVFDLYAFTVVVKDTSLGRRRGPLDL
jgi:hypothetical protein